VQLQLSLTLADDLYDLLLLRGEPVDYMFAAERLLALRGSPPVLCRQVMATLVEEDRRFCWSSPSTIGLGDWRLTDPDLAEVAFVVVDLETTGTRPGLGKITEVGAVRIEGLREVALFETLVNPQRPMAPKVIEITGITPQMVVGAPRIEQVMPHFLDFIQGAVLVAHNASFDLSFLNYELARLKGRRLGEGAIDTVQLARCVAPGLDNYKLGTVSYALGSPVRSCHRALADAQATAHVFLTLVGRLQERGVTHLNQLRIHVDPGHKGDRHKVALTRDLPRAPGTYLFLDEEGTVLYVGKADVLRDRVRSYFLSGASHSRKVRQAVRRLRSVEWEETASPLEAVVREQELILDHRPTCNVLGRRPENYVYLKVAHKPGTGLRLYLSDRPGAVGRDNEAPAGPGESATVGSAGRDGVAAIGPFRARTRVQAALDLLQRCYPVRRCARVNRSGRPCLFGATRRCLSPCMGEGDRLEEHDELVRGLIAWICGEGAPGGGPMERARAVMLELSEQRRYEEAEEVRAGLDELRGLRRAYRALEEALRLCAATLWPLIDRPGEVRVDIVWRGRLAHKLNLSRGTAGVELGRALRTFDPADLQLSGEPDDRPQFSRDERSLVAVPQQELDLLLVARRWFLDTPGAQTVHLPAEGRAEERLEAWRQAIVAAVLERLPGE
jgi:DNA polymerase III subunit epsilon